MTKTTLFRFYGMRRDERSSHSSSEMMSTNPAEHSSLALKRLLSLIVGCLAVGISYMVNTFNVFALALKERLHLSQLEFEFILAITFLGLLASLPGGIILNRIGARMTAAIAMVISVVGYILVCLCVTYANYYKLHYPLTCFSFLIAGIGGGLTYMVGTVANVRNFSDKVRGTIVGVIHASLSFGPAVIMFVYTAFFTRNAETYGDENIEGFFIFIACSFGFINLLGIFLYGDYPPIDDTDTQDDIQTEQEQEDIRKLYLKNVRRSLEPSDCNWVTASYDTFESRDVCRPRISRSDTNIFQSYQNSEADRRRSIMIDLFSTSVKPLVKSVDQFSYAETYPGDENSYAIFCFYIKQFCSADFQLFFWSSSILMSFMMMYVQNLTIILRAFYLDEYINIFPFLSPIFGTIAKPVLGILSDVLVKHVPRSVFLLVATIANTMLFIVSLWYFHEIYLIFTIIIVVDVGAYTVYSIGPAIIIERWDLRMFPVLWSCIISGFAILTSIQLIIFGLIYDFRHDVEHPTIECFGDDCFRNTNIITLCLSICSFIFFSFYIHRNHNDISVESP